MKKIYLLLSFVFVCALSVQAQGFAEHLESTQTGQGRVTLIQDERLTSILNAGTSLREEAAKKDEDFDMQKGKLKRVRGYRVQMFWGNSSRADQQKADRIGTQVTTIFPELKYYTSFDSPHWRCRVGDFVSREEANKYLKKLRRISKDAMIVRSEIFVYQ